jgi:molybdopterin-containing oxidoreductase family iron-sulfur binding subunit
LQDDWTRAPGLGGGGQDLEIVFRLDPTVLDGRFANNGWLQELPKPLSKLTWDNAAFISAATARRLGFADAVAANGEMVELDYRERRLQIPLWVLPGHADNSVTVHLGYGRSRAGRVGTGLGFNAYVLRTSRALWCDGGLRLPRLLGRRYTLAATHQHHLMHNRELIRAGNLADRHRLEDDIRASRQQRVSLYPGFSYDGNKWGVRSRGVMEKCTYCVQRIRRAQIESEREDRALGDGEILTACQAACPAGAIVFGDLNARPASKAAQLKGEPLHYSLLDELNTWPRTTYLGALRNPNPDIDRIENAS